MVAASSVGDLTFSDAVRRQRFTSEEYARWVQLETDRLPLDLDMANTYARALKDWAMEKGSGLR